MHLPHYKLLRYFAECEPISHYSLSSAECEPLAIPELLTFDKEKARHFKELQIGYTPSQGGIALRETIAKEYSHITPEEVLVTTGAEEAIFLFLSTQLKKGDHAIVQTPCYQPYYEIPRSLGCEVSFWKGIESDGWECDLDEFKNMLQDNTRLLIMSCPGALTGNLLSTKKLFDIVEIAREARLLFLCDESYRGLEYFAQEQVPAVCDAYERGVSVGGLSKSLGFPGLRIGWVATRDKVVLHEMSAMKDYTTGFCSTPSEFLAQIAIEHAGKIREANLALIESNLKLFQAFLKKYRSQFTCQIPRAGCQALLHLKQDDAELLCDDLLEKAELLAVPSSCFDFGNRHLRVGFGRENFERALEQFEKFLEAPQVRRAAS